LLYETYVDDFQCSDELGGGVAYCLAVHSLTWSFQVPYCSVAMLEEVIEDDETSMMQMGGRSSPTLSRAGRHSPTLSRLGGRSSPGGISSMSLMSRSTIRTPAPPPKVWRIVQPPFPPMTHTSVSTFDWKMLLDKE